MRQCILIAMLSLMLSGCTATSWRDVFARGTIIQPDAAFVAEARAEVQSRGFVAPVDASWCYVCGEVELSSQVSRAAIWCQ